MMMKPKRKKEKTIVGKAPMNPLMSMQKGGKMAAGKKKAKKK